LKQPLRGRYILLPGDNAPAPDLARLGNRKLGLRNLPALVAGLCLIALICSPVLAQDGAADDNTVVYDETFFSRYNVNNAEDMLRLIPGVATILDTRANQQERGFGTAGTQVLINGRRFPGKSNEINTNLRRIPPDYVLRVELIRGVSGDIAVRSGGLLVNLVLREGATLGGTGAWELNARFNDQGDEGLDGLLSYNGVWRQVSYSLGIERNLWSPPAGDQRWTYRFRDELYFHPTGELAETRPQSWQRDHEKWIFTGGLIYDFANRDRLELNAFYQTLAIQEKETTPFVRFDTDGLETLRATDYRTRAFETTAGSLVLPYTARTSAPSSTTEIAFFPPKLRSSTVAPPIPRCVKTFCVRLISGRCPTSTRSNSPPKAPATRSIRPSPCSSTSTKTERSKRYPFPPQ
jgi:hypothetical protein